MCEWAQWNRKKKEKKNAYTNCEQGLQLFMGSGSLLGKEEEGMSGSDLPAKAHILDTGCPESNVKLSLYFNQGQATCCKNLLFQMHLFSDQYHDSK